MRSKPLHSLVVVLLLASCNITPDSKAPYHRGLTVYPNPADAEVNIYLESSANGGNLSVIDSKGDEFFNEPLTTGDNEFHIPLNGKPEGIFHVVVKQNNQSYTSEFIHL